MWQFSIIEDLFDSEMFRSTFEYVLVRKGDLLKFLHDQNLSPLARLMSGILIVCVLFIIASAFVTILRFMLSALKWILIAALFIMLIKWILEIQTIDE